MENLESAFRTFVLSNPTIHSLVSSRFYWDKIEDNAGLPYIYANTISDVPVYSYKGKNVGIWFVQLDLISKSKSESVTLFNALENFLGNGFSGSIGGRNCLLFFRNAPGNWDGANRYFRKIVEIEVKYA